MAEQRQQLVLQTLMARGALSEANFATLIADVSRRLGLAIPGGSAERQCNALMEELKASLRFMGMEVRRGVAEDSEEVYYGLVNVRADDIAQIATRFSFNELLVFKKIVELIIVSPPNNFGQRKPPKKRGTVSLNRILTKVERPVLANVTLDRLLERLVADLWLWQVHSCPSHLFAPPSYTLTTPAAVFAAVSTFLTLDTQRGSHYGLGVRSILELGAYMEEAFEEDDTVDCSICQEMVSFGEACPTPNCKAKLHRHCLHAFAQNRPVVQCPTCRQDWRVAVGDVPLDDEDA